MYVPHMTEVITMSYPSNHETPDILSLPPPLRIVEHFLLQATALIVGLAGERTRWTEDSRKFADTKRRLVGDVALACAFVGYCGPFNQEFRHYLIKTRCV